MWLGTGRVVRFRALGHDLWIGQHMHCEDVGLSSTCFGRSVKPISHIARQPGALPIERLGQPQLIQLPD